jgi:hypothetical protein
MFARKKSKAPLFCIAIFPEQELSNEEYDLQADQILDETEESVVAVTEMTLSYEMKSELQNQFPDSKIEVPCYAVFHYDPEKLDEETKKMEKKYKWKKFFNNIPIDEYLIVEQKVSYNPNQVLYYTTEVDRLISYIKEQKIE